MLSFTNALTDAHIFYLKTSKICEQSHLPWNSIFIELNLSDPEVNRLLGDPRSKLTEVKLLYYGKANVAW